MLGHSLGKDHRLEQAVRCQSVGSVHAGAGHLADGVEVWHGFSGALQKSSPDVIHTNASHHVMGSGNHRNRITSELKPFLGQTASDGGEFFLPWKIEMRGDQVNTGCAVFLHLLVNGACTMSRVASEPAEVCSRVKEYGAGEGLSSPWSEAALKSRVHAAKPSSSSKTAPTPRTASEMRNGRGEGDARAVG